MKSTYRMLQIVRAAMLFSIVLYGLMILEFPSNTRANSVHYYVILLVAVWIVVGLFRFRRRLVNPSENVLGTNPEDPVAQKRWRMGHLLTYAFSDAIALYGLLLHFLGFKMPQVAPFLVTGFLLIVFYPPRLPATLRG